MGSSKTIARSSGSPTSPRDLGDGPDGAGLSPASSDDLHLGYLDPARWADTIEVDRVVFADTPSPAVAAAEQSVLPADRVLTVTAGDAATGQVVATAGSYRFDLTLPGGTTLPVAGVTNVGVLPTHRRRGLFRRLMVRQHDDIAAEGFAVAVLNASDARIYGRFGYGMASRYAVVRIDTHRSGFATAPPTRSLRLMRSAHASDVLPALYSAAAATRPGTLSRSAAWWAMMLGDTEMWKGGGHHEVVVAEAEGDDLGGYAVYRVAPDGEGVRVTVREVVAATDGTHAALWRYLLDVDLALSVEAEMPVDDAVLWWLDDPRALTTQQVRDFLFVRILDTPAALSARRFRVPVDVVLEVTDHFRPHGGAAGRFMLRGDSNGAMCIPTADDPDITLGVDALGSLLLGGVDAHVLAAVGRITAHRSDAVDAVATAFGWSPAPFCATRF